MKEPEKKERSNDDHAGHDVNEEHPEREGTGVSDRIAQPVQEGDRHQVDARNTQNGRQGKDAQEQGFQPPADGGQVSPPFAVHQVEPGGRCTASQGRSGMVHKTPREKK